MKVSQAKYLVQQLVHSEGWAKEEIIEGFPELVKESQRLAKGGIHLYRGLKIEEGQGVRPHSVASVSRQLTSCLGVLEKMPSIVFSESKTITFSNALLSFRVPQEKVLLDMDRVVLPALRDKLKNVMHHTVENKYGERVKISAALDEYERNRETEVIADLEGLPCKSAFLGENVHGKNVKWELDMLLSKRKGGLDKDNPEIISEAIDLARSILSKEDYLTALKFLKREGVKVALPKKETEMALAM